MTKSLFKSLVSSSNNSRLYFNMVSLWLLELWSPSFVDFVSSKPSSFSSSPPSENVESFSSGNTSKKHDYVDNILMRQKNFPNCLN